MKKCTVILGSIIGGAALGTAITLCLTSKKGVEMRRMTHMKILEQLEHLHSHIEGCTCSESGECDCGGGAMEKIEEKMGQMGAKLASKVSDVAKS